jgi:SAM-dependent methyltransferase
MTAPVGRAPADGQVREVLSLFEAKAARWSAKYAPDGPLAVRLARLAAAVGRAAPPGDRVLDLGCATGELARALAAAGYAVTGCDISGEMLTRAAASHEAREGGGPGWVQLAPGWRTLPFTSGAFGAVVASSVLEYVTDPAAVLRECARVTRPGGAVLYTVPDLRHPVRWVEWPAARLVFLPNEAGRSRWHNYHAYLRASRQRHRVRWWQAASGQAGLIPLSVAGNHRSPLRLLAFRRHGESGMRALLLRGRRHFGPRRGVPAEREPDGQ